MYQLFSLLHLALSTQVAVNVYVCGYIVSSEEAVYVEEEEEEISVVLTRRK